MIAALARLTHAAPQALLPRHVGNVRAKYPLTPRGSCVIFRYRRMKFPGYTIPLRTAHTAA